MEGSVKKYRSGEVIFKQGEKGGSFLIIEEGSVEVFKEAAHGAIPLVCLGEGEILGLLSFYNEGPRLASARARTDVEGRLIKKSADMDKAELPPWVPIVFKEYALRLGQVNDLYIRSVSDNQELVGHVMDPLHVAAQVASVFGNFADFMGITIADGREMLVIKDIIDRAESILGYERIDIERVVHIFTQFGLMKKEVEPDKHLEVVSVKSVKKLPWFSEFIRMSKSGKAKKLIETYIPYKNRKVLFALRDFAGFSGRKGSETVVIPMSEITEKFQEATKLEFQSSAIEQAKEINLVDLKEQKGETCLVYHPYNLARTVIALNVINQLKKHPDIRDEEENVISY